MPRTGLVPSRFLSAGRAGDLEAVETRTATLVRALPCIVTLETPVDWER